MIEGSVATASALLAMGRQDCDQEWGFELIKGVGLIK